MGSNRNPAEDDPSYFALLLVSREAAQNRTLSDRLQQLVGTISQADMQEANRQVDVRKQPAHTAAAELLMPLPGRTLPRH